MDENLKGSVEAAPTHRHRYCMKNGHLRVGFVNIERPSRVAMQPKVSLYTLVERNQIGTNATSDEPTHMMQ